MNLDIFFQIADVLGVLATTALTYFVFKMIPQHAMDKPYSLFSRFTKWTFCQGFGLQTFLFFTGIAMLVLVMYAQLVWTMAAVFIAGIVLALRLRKYYGNAGNARWAGC